MLLMIERVITSKLNSPVRNPTTRAATAPADKVMMSVSRLKSTTLASMAGTSFLCTGTFYCFIFTLSSISRTT